MKPWSPVLSENRPARLPELLIALTEVLPGSAPGTSIVVKKPGVKESARMVVRELKRPRTNSIKTVVSFICSSLLQGYALRSPISFLRFAPVPAPLTEARHAPPLHEIACSVGIGHARSGLK